jgi:inner membrane protein
MLTLLEATAPTGKPVPSAVRPHMNPLTHALLGWTLAQVVPLTRRDRALVTLAGVVPDIDGLGVVAELLTRDRANPLLWWSEYHHVLAHNLDGALVVTIAVICLAHRRWVGAALACTSFHLHLLGDLVGGRGPDGYQWSIPYLAPFSAACHLTWSGQWALNAWPNILLTILLLALMCFFAWQRGYSPLEIVSTKTDQHFVEALRARVGEAYLQLRKL